MARIEAFGYTPTAARAHVVERSASWRMTRALLAAAVGLGAAPVVFLVPPHVPWALAALGLGAWFARRFVRERRTLLSLDGVCPRCGAAVTTHEPTALRTPHDLTCGACRQGLLVRVDD